MNKIVCVRWSAVSIWLLVTGCAVPNGEDGQDEKNNSHHSSEDGPEEETTTNEAQAATSATSAPVCAAKCAAFEACVTAAVAAHIANGTPFDAVTCAAPCDGPSVPFAQGQWSACETVAQVQTRQAAVLARRKLAVPAPAAGCAVDKNRLVVAHRGASEFARENTLEAYAAAFALGADANETDIRFTPTGNIYIFHDDMLAGQFFAHGATDQASWQTISSAQPRNPGPFAAHVRVPTLFDYLKIHRTYAGYMLLDYKAVDPIPTFDPAAPFRAPVVARADADAIVRSIVHALRMDSQILNDLIAGSPYLPHVHLELDGKDVDPVHIAQALSGTGGKVIETHDPRAVAEAMCRPVSQPSCTPFAPARRLPVVAGTQTQWAATMASCAPTAAIIGTTSEQAAQIRTCAEAAFRLRRFASLSAVTKSRLLDRGWNRSKHREYINSNGSDGAEAIATALFRNVPGASQLARDVLWRADATLQPIATNITSLYGWTMMPAWTDFSVKQVTWRSLPLGNATATIASDYLALADSARMNIGFDEREIAVRLWLRSVPTSQTAAALLAHPSAKVRAIAVYELLDYASRGQTWALDALAVYSADAASWVGPTRCQL